MAKIPCGGFEVDSTLAFNNNTLGVVGLTDKELILASSTKDSTKKFKITVTDDGTVTATEIQ